MSTIESTLSDAAASVASLFGRWSQTSRIMRLHTVLDASHGPNILMAEVLQGTEGMGGYTLQLSALSQNAHLDLKTLIGQPVLLELLTDQSRTANQSDLRPFHGHITQAQCVGSNAGMARYLLTIEPWSAFLRYRRDSAIYQDMGVLQIIESIFNDYQAQGTLAPQWRIDVADPAAYPQYSLITQYQESDLAFVERLLAQEGLFYWVEHTGDTASPTLGSHTLVIADHNAAFTPNPRSQIEFTQPGAVMQADTLDRWRSQRIWQTNAIEISSWDYRQTNTRAVAAYSSANSTTDPDAQATPLVSTDAPGAYAYESRAHGQRLADNQLQALQVQDKTYTGAGTVRSLSPATTFTLSGHPDQGAQASDNTFVVLDITHRAYNNLTAELRSAVVQRLGQAVLPALKGAVEGALNPSLAGDLQVKSASSPHGTSASSYTSDSKTALGNSPEAPPKALYRNCFTAIRADIAYRPSTNDQHGTLLHPKPTVYGQQSAIVVGPPGQDIYTDRDHRVKVQFHWARGANSHSRLAHPAADGHSGAPADHSAGTWVRVLSAIAPTAGANWGGTGVPRIGQEVLIDFLEGDIDRPVVIGALYNGQGNTNQAHNQSTQGAGSATGNAPMWFPGQGAEQSSGHAHGAALSGIKTQSMGASQSGVGGYNQLVFDDSPGQSRAALQHHAAAHQGTAELNLGQLRHQSDNQRLQPSGYGFELKTQHSTAIRAGAGLLLSTDAKNGNASGAASTQLDSREAADQAQSSQQLQQSLADTAQKHNAKLSTEPAPDKIPAIAASSDSAEVLQASQSGAGGNGQNTATAYSAPHLQLSSPAGIAALTPASAILTAGQTSSYTAGHDINLAAQANSHHLVKGGISLFTYGKASNPKKPNQEVGIALHAASGKVSVQSQSGPTALTADKAITVASVTSSITVASPKKILLTAGGAGITIEGGNITLTAGGTVALKGSLKELTGPGSASASLALPKPGPLKVCEFKAGAAANGGDAVVGL